MLSKGKWPNRTDRRCRYLLDQAQVQTGHDRPKSSTEKMPPFPPLAAKHAKALLQIGYQSTTHLFEQTHSQ